MTMLQANIPVQAQVLPLNFDLPKNLEQSIPTEERGLNRDDVRLMVSNLQTDKVYHSVFRQLSDYLEAGDVLVINTSGTLKAALEGVLVEGDIPVRVHLSTKIKEKEWVIELRQLEGEETKRYTEAKEGQYIQLRGGGRLQLTAPYYTHTSDQHLQLWKATFDLSINVENYLQKYGVPIRYNQAKANYPASYYQTAYAQQMGSAEMPSAGRAFTPELITQLVAKGILILPILLHTGVASIEWNERPYTEYFEVPETTAYLLNEARKRQKRIIAVGTTVVRALETATNQGITQAQKGWTDIFITPQTGIQAVNGLMTGFHEPKASHLLMLEALAGRQHLAITYEAAIQNKYWWHEFGDLHLMI